MPRKPLPPTSIPPSRLSQQALSSAINHQHQSHLQLYGKKVSTHCQFKPSSGLGTPNSSPRQLGNQTTRTRREVFIPPFLPMDCLHRHQLSLQPCRGSLRQRRPRCHVCWIYITFWLQLPPLFNPSIYLTSPPGTFPKQPLKSPHYSKRTKKTARPGSTISYSLTPSLSNQPQIQKSSIQTTKSPPACFAYFSPKANSAWMLIVPLRTSLTL